MSKCWYCNEEITSGNNPEHLGICNKCYDEMFKCGNEFVKNMITKMSDLKSKLAESEKKLNQYSYKNDVIEKQYEDLKDAITFLMLNNIKDQEQLNHCIDVLCEKHKARIRDIENGICSIEQLKQQLAEKDKAFNWLHEKYANYIIANQDKTEFAIEQLEKLANNSVILEGMFLEGGHYLHQKRYNVVGKGDIENLIKELKEKK